MISRQKQSFGSARHESQDRATVVHVDSYHWCAQIVRRFAAQSEGTNAVGLDETSRIEGAAPVAILADRQRENSLSGALTTSIYQRRATRVFWGAILNVHRIGAAWCTMRPAVINARTVETNGIHSTDHRHLAVQQVKQRVCNV